PGLTDNCQGALSHYGMNLRLAYCARNAQTNKSLSSSPKHRGSGDVSTAPNGRAGSALGQVAPFSPTAVTTATATANLQRNAAAGSMEGLVHTWPALQPPITYYASAEDAQCNVAASGLSPLWKLLLLSDGSVTRHLQLLSGSPVSVECLSLRNVGCSLEGLPAGTDLIPGPRVQRQVLLRCQPDLVSQCKTHGTKNNSDNSNSTTTTSSSSSSSSSSSRNMDCVPTGNSEDTSAGSSNSSGCRIETFESSGGGRRNGNAASTDPKAIVDSANDDVSSRSDGSTYPGSGPPLLPLLYASSWWNAETIDEYLRDKSKPIWVSLSQGHVELYREVHALFRGESPQLEGLLGCPGPFWGRQYVFWSGGQPLTLIYEVFSPKLEQYLGPAGAGADRVVADVGSFHS
ncbi:hypothetical protein VaNZ11_002337, partial [Volvox africanus]